MVSQNKPLVIKGEFFFCNGDLPQQGFIDDLKKRLALRMPRCIAIYYFDYSGRMASVLMRAQPAKSNGREVTKLFVDELIGQLRQGSFGTIQVDGRACAILRHEGMPSVWRQISQAHLREFSLYSSGALYEESLVRIARHSYRKLAAEQ